MAATSTKKKTTAKKATKKASKDLTPEHKAAMQEGREQSRAVRRYLDEVKSSGRPSKRDRGKAEQRLEKAKKRVESASTSAEQLLAIQARIDAERELAEIDEASEFEQLEKDFIANVKPWAESKGVTWPAMREMGVPASVLREAGVRQERRKR